MVCNSIPIKSFTFYFLLKLKIVNISSWNLNFWNQIQFVTRFMQCQQMKAIHKYLIMFQKSKWANNDILCLIFHRACSYLVSGLDFLIFVQIFPVYGHNCRSIALLNHSFCLCNSGQKIHLFYS